MSPEWWQFPLLFCLTNDLKIKTLHWFCVAFMWLKLSLTISWPKLGTVPISNLNSNRQSNLRYMQFLFQSKTKLIHKLKVKLKWLLFIFIILLFNFFYLLFNFFFAKRQTHIINLIIRSLIKRWVNMHCNCNCIVAHSFFFNFGNNYR